MIRRLYAATAALAALAACTSSSSPAGSPPHIVASSSPTTSIASRLPELGSATTSSQPVARPTPPAPRASRASRARPAIAATGDVWEALARCESGGDPTRVSRTGAYRGAFQFSLRTWRSMGTGYGDPIAAPYAVQLDAARRLQARSGWGQWPTCARKLGLL